MAKKFKALMLDVDGTIMVHKEAGKPSDKVREAIEKSSKILHVGVATSRPYFILKPIVDQLSLNGPSIINGGSQIMDMQTRKIIWEKVIDANIIPIICRILEKNGLKVKVCEGTEESDFEESKKYVRGTQIWGQGVAIEKADMVVDELSKISSIGITKAVSWLPGKIDILITHAKATKQHGVLKVAEFLGISTKEIIGVGDSYQDFPLLMACGLKIAMGNAVDELKAIADYIAPSVYEDGVVDVIEKFVYHPREQSNG